jgi:hypothetical protein
MGIEDENDSPTNPMNDEDDPPHITRMEADCAILESIAAKYTLGSPEETAIRRSAFARIFVTLHHEREFAAFLAKFATPRTLTAEEEPTSRVRHRRRYTRHSRN